MDEFKKYFETASNGIHRFATEEFYAKESAEKLFHIGSPIALLDFGCGTADLTVYFAKVVRRVVGVDFSENMLLHARRRATQFGLDGVTFICANDVSIWDELGDRTFDVITSAGTMQYMSLENFERFTKRSLDYLVPGGRILHFDIPDPRIYLLFRLGLFGPKGWGVGAIPRVLVNLGKLGIRKGLELVKGRPSDIIGYRHHPDDLRNVGKRCGVDVETVSSMYYEYRYHIFMTKPASLSTTKSG